MSQEDNIWPEVPDGPLERPRPDEPTPPEVSETATPSEADEVDDAAIAQAFGRDLMRFVLPFRTGEEAGTFLCVLILVAAWPLLKIMSLFCCFNWLVLAGIAGCLATFLFDVLTEAADGHNSLPTLASIKTTVMEDFWGGIIVPLSNFYAAILYAFLPSIAVSLIYLVVTQDSPAMTAWPRPLFAVSLGLGAFLTPMVMLVLARKQLGLLLRPDRIIRSIIAVWRPYLVCWFCLLIAFGLPMGVRLLHLTESGLSPIGDLAFAILVSILEICIFIYTMRVIGLLYRHYRHRLDWAADEQPVYPGGGEFFS